MGARNSKQSNNTAVVEETGTEKTLLSSGAQDHVKLEARTSAADERLSTVPMEASVGEGCEASRESEAASSIDILPEDKIQWMWADAGFVSQKVGVKNPLRWSSAKSPVDTISEFARCSGKKVERPVDVVIKRAGAILRKARFNNVAEAMAALSPQATIEHKEEQSAEDPQPTEETQPTEAPLVEEAPRRDVSVAEAPVAIEAEPFVEAHVVENAKAAFETLAAEVPQEEIPVDMVQPKEEAKPAEAPAPEEVPKEEMPAAEVPATEDAKAAMEAQVADLPNEEKPADEAQPMEEPKPAEAPAPEEAPKDDKPDTAVPSSEEAKAAAEATAAEALKEERPADEAQSKEELKAAEALTVEEAPTEDNAAAEAPAVAPAPEETVKEDGKEDEPVTESPSTDEANVAAEALVVASPKDEEPADEVQPQEEAKSAEAPAPEEELKDQLAAEAPAIEEAKVVAEAPAAQAPVEEKPVDSAQPNEEKKVADAPAPEDASKEDKLAAEAPSTDQAEVATEALVVEAPKDVKSVDESQREDEAKLAEASAPEEPEEKIEGEQQDSDPTAAAAGEERASIEQGLSSAVDVAGEELHVTEADTKVEKARVIIEAALYATVATSSSDGEPWASPVAFWCTSKGLCFATPSSSLKAMNVSSNPACSVSIFDSSAAFMTGCGVQCLGEAAVVPLQTWPQVLNGIRHRFPNIESDVVEEHINMFTALGYSLVEITITSTYINLFDPQQGGDYRADVKIDWSALQLSPFSQAASLGPPPEVQDIPRICDPATTTQNILEHALYVIVASLNNEYKPWASPVAFWPTQTGVCFATPKNSLKASNLVSNARCSFSIFDSRAAFMMGAGIQCIGNASVAPTECWPSLLEGISGRFPHFDGDVVEQHVCMFSMMDYVLIEVAVEKAFISAFDPEKGGDHRVEIGIDWKDLKESQKVAPFSLAKTLGGS